MSRHEVEAREETEPVTLEETAQVAGGGRYQLLQLLGRGAMGEVFVAREHALSRKVAFKRMAQKVAQDKALAARFLREMQVTAQLDHPNVVPVYADERGADGTPGYAMKLVRGRTLSTLIEESARGASKRSRRNEAQALAQRLELFLRVCDAVAYAHAKGVLHRDLKPDNVMIGPYNEVYVMDWGICRVQGAADADLIELPAADDGALTRTGAVMGTPAYMSPEQAKGKNDALDGRSDQFSLGLILFELVALKGARRKAGVRETLVSAVSGAREPLAHVNGSFEIPRELAAIVDKACAPDRDARYPSVEALAEDVRRCLRGEAVEARADTPLQAALRFIGRHQRGTLAALVVTLLLGSALTIFALVRGQEQKEAEHRRSQQIARFVARVDEQAHLVDTHFERSRGLVRALAARTGALLSHPEGKERAFWTSDLFDAGHGPPDARPSPVHGRAISIDFPSFKLSPGVEAAAVRDDLSALAQLAPAFQANLRAMLPEEGVHVDDAAFRTLVAETGLPILRQYVSLASGVHEVYPGQGGYPPEYDGRLRPKYTLAANTRGVLFGNPYADHLGGGDLLPGSAAIYDDEGRFRGVCGLDLPFSDLRARLLPLPEQAGYLEAFLVDQDGRVLLRTGASTPEEPGLHNNAALEREPLPWPEATRALAAQRAGTVELKGRKLAAFAPVTATGWRYLAVADLGRLLAQ